MPSKRKAEFFDPNKSDSDDTDYQSGQDKPRRVSRKSHAKSKKSSGGGKRRRMKYKGSDISEDDNGSDDMEGYFSSSDEEEDEIEVDPTTGRARRKAAKKEVNYEDPSESEIDDLVDDDSDDDEGDEDDDEDVNPSKRPRQSRIITLKVPNLAVQPTSRSKRAGSAARTRSGMSMEPQSGAPRRSTRAHTEEGDLVALTTSGRHVEAVRSSRSPEPVRRSSRGAKGLKVPASTIREEPHESSSYEQSGPTGDANEKEEVEGAEQEREDEPMDDENDEQKGDIAANDNEAAVVEAAVDDDDDDDDDMPVTRAGRTRGSRANIHESLEDAEVVVEETTVETTTTTGRRLTRKSAAAARKNTQEQSSDFEPGEESAEEEISESDGSPQKGGGEDTDSTRRGRRVAQGKSKSARSSRRRGSANSDDDLELDPDELMEEAQELKAGRRSRRRERSSDILFMTQHEKRQRKPVDYTIKPMDQIYAADEDLEEMAATPSRRGKRGGNGGSQPWERNLHTTYGPFGGGVGPAPVIGGPWGTGATGGVESDSSDDENMARPNVGSNVGMTPTAATGGGLLPGLTQTNPTDPIAAIGGTPANLGKIKSQKALADADPLGVDQNIDFSKVGGLQGHIDQLKEMVQMPLLYPELFQRFHVTPPRGVLFHGPPGTGKTLLARALAAQVGAGGRKITFYMRKGADALSKWVGEAERQLRLLFEEARKTQPSIIFFDEIDGLAPVRSSKQEQIHASIVSTLLALMDGMDGRGQVIVIGATNRPDNIDPALRRPGRFDREFYFPLPDLDGRRSILNIHTKDWGIDDIFKDSLAHITKGYGGADLRALCTEAALNAIQRTYPQIYSSNDKLIVDPHKIKITAKDFMLSVKKMIPSSERSTSSGAAPLPKIVEPLLRDQLKALTDILDGLIPRKKKKTALEEAMFEQEEDADQGFGRETLQQEFEKSRVFRPRLLIQGEPGMGQAYIGAALLNHFEGLHVQNFDLPTIFTDSARSAETAIVQLFAEVKRHKPSVIFLPGIDTWYHTLSEPVITTFLGLLRAIPPTDPVLVLGIADAEPDKIDQDLLRDLFGFSHKNRFTITRPSREHQEEFFRNVIAYVKKAPKDFPDPVNRKKRRLETLEIAPPPPPREPTKEEIKAIKKRDNLTLNTLKTLIQPIMDQIQKKYRKFRVPVIPQSQIQYLYDEQDPNFVHSNIAQFRPYELGKDKDGIPGLRETSTGKFFYNLETTTIEERLSNGYYARPKDFVADIRSLVKDARNIGDKDRMLKANELLANVEVDIAVLESNPLMADCENVYQRQVQRAKEKAEKYQRRAEQDPGLAKLVAADMPVPGQDAASDEQGPVPIRLGDPVSRPRTAAENTPFASPTSMSNGCNHQHMSNGSSVPSRGNSGDDVQMTGTDDGPPSHQTPFNSQDMPPPTSQFSKLSRGPSNMSSYPGGMHTQVSQHSGFQQISHDISPDALINDASTTSSDKKTSDPSRSSGATHVTNGKVDISTFFDTPERPQGESQLTDTQHAENIQGGTSGSQEQWLHSQAHGLARGQLQSAYTSQSPSSGSQSRPHVFEEPTRATTDSFSKPTGNDIRSLLNNEPTSSQASSQKELIIDEAYIDSLVSTFVSKSSGCSIEQLVQINRELMDCLWRTRGEWNRTRVGTELSAVFNEVITDIETIQNLLNPSQISQASQVA